MPFKHHKYFLVMLAFFHAIQTDLLFLNNTSVLYHAIQTDFPFLSKASVLFHAIQTDLPIDPSHKSGPLCIRQISHHFVTEMCTNVHISVTKWCIMGYATGVLWDLWDGSILNNAIILSHNIQTDLPYLHILLTPVFHQSTGADAITTYKKITGLDV